MILITHQLDSISVTQAYLNDITKGSIIEFISDMNELQDDIIYQFTDIMTRINYTSNDINDDWRIFKLLVGNLKTVYNENKIISEYKDSISILCDNIPAVKLSKYFKTHLCNLDYIPLIVKKLKLIDLYEQLVFHEYIYMSENVSYRYKLICMIENNYELLMYLITNCYVDTCSNGLQETKEHLLMVYNTYFGSPNFNIFKCFEEHHKKYFDYYEELTDKGTDIYNFILNNEEFKHEPIKLIDLCYLNSIYENNKKKIETFICRYKEHIIFNMDDILLYEVYDMFVKMMEIDSPVIVSFGNRILSKIFTKWMFMSNPSYYCHAEQPSYPYNYDKKQRLRDIFLSTTIKNILNTNNYTFNEMGYILTKDRLDMFVIVTRNLRFRTIHPDILKYMSPKIMKYIIDKCLNMQNIQQIDYKNETIIINPYNFADRSEDDMKTSVRLINHYINNYKLDYISVMNTYNFVDCVYISLYWLYVELLNNNIGRNVLIFISNIDNPYNTFLSNYLEFAMLRIVVDDVYINRNIIDNYFYDALSDNNFIDTGMDIDEIKNELEQYNIINNYFINNIKNILSESSDL
jgi:hypothetical protein